MQINKREIFLHKGNQRKDPFKGRASSLTKIIFIHINIPFISFEKKKQKRKSFQGKILSKSSQLMKFTNPSTSRYTQMF